jgi:hypothetical protein
MEIIGKLEEELRRTAKDSQLLFDALTRKRFRHQGHAGSAWASLRKGNYIQARALWRMRDTVQSASRHIVPLFSRGAHLVASLDE